MVRGGLNLALALALASAADAQFLRGSSFFGSGSTKSFMSSWSRDADGQMHQQVQETSTQTVQTDGGLQSIEKRMVCKDGHCREEIISTPMAAEQPRSFWMHPHVLAVLRFVSPGRASIMVIPAQQQNQQPEEPSQQFAMLRGIVGGPNKYASMQLVGMPSAKHSSKIVFDDYTLPFMVAGLALSVVMLASLVGAQLLQQRHSTREMSNLAAPLASGDAAPTGKAARKTAAQKEEPTTIAARVAQGYLQELYAKTQSNIEHGAVVQYLGTVYERATA
mmetsp:Transcript_4142/g.10482  ORF Transcript_4142/g.10482 Transcript_4142/m.10482 type:complete len:277 (-) Transcript_4142:162-992(-)